MLTILKRGIGNMRKTPRMAGLEIKKKRQSRKILGRTMTQADLADALFTSERHIRNLERGACSLPLYLAARNFLGMDSDVENNGQD